jgi:transcriptional regulator with XRE-family HTH domain
VISRGRDAAGMLDGQLIARTIRASRVRLALRQIDVARLVGVSRDAVSAIENGRVGSVRVGELEQVAGACGLRVRIELVAARGDLGRLGDGAHAHLVEAIARLLQENGWEVALEAQTSRGSIDVLAFHPRGRMLLVVEVKTRLIDLQETLRSLGRLAGDALGASRRLGWHAAATSVLLVVGESSTQRRIVRLHRAIFAAAFPVRTREMRRWLAAPDVVVRGLMFLPYASRRDVMHHVAIRVRHPATRSSVVHARSGRQGPALGSSSIPPAG